MNNLQDLPDGIYFLEIGSNEQIVTKKLVRKYAGKRGSGEAGKRGCGEVGKWGSGELLTKMVWHKHSFCLLLLQSLYELFP